MGNDRFEGFSADLALRVAKIVGFEYVIQPVKDGKYGEKIKDGTWNGMVGELTRRVCHTKSFRYSFCVCCCALKF